MAYRFMTLSSISAEPRNREKHPGLQRTQPNTCSVAFWNQWPTAYSKIWYHTIGPVELSGGDIINYQLILTYMTQTTFVSPLSAYWLSSVLVYSINFIICNVIRARQIYKSYTVLFFIIFTVIMDIISTVGVSAKWNLC